MAGVEGQVAIGKVAGSANGIGLAAAQAQAHAREERGWLLLQPNASPWTARKNWAGPTVVSVVCGCRADTTSWVLPSTISTRGR